MDPSSVGTVVKALATTARVAKVVLDKLHQVGPTARLQEAMEVDHRSWRAARDAQVEARLAGLEAAAIEPATFEQSVVEMANDVQFARLQANVEYEALREATDDRRLMLAYAAAGLADPNLPLNLKARIERTLRGLDPVDIITLRRVAEFGHLDRRVEQEFPISFAALVAAGCIQARDGGTWDVGTRAESTRLGEEVLRVLATYQPSVEEPVEVEKSHA